jgi:hypothetical protein
MTSTAAGAIPTKHYAVAQAFRATPAGAHQYVLQSGAGVLAFKRMLTAASGTITPGAAGGWRPNGGATWAAGPMSLRP